MCDKEVFSTKEGWNHLAKFYTEFREFGGKFNKQDKARLGEYPYMTKLIKEAGIKDKRVLDVGCGYGFYSFIAEQLEAKRVVGIDFSEEMIKLALEEKMKRGSEVEFVSASIEDIPFSDDSFDVITSGMALDLSNLDAGFKELRRILTRGGSMIFSVPHPLATHGKYNANGEFVTGAYFKSEEYVARWHDELGKPVEFMRANRTTEDYTESLYQNGFVLIRLFESKPVTPLNYTGEENALITRMMDIPSYLVIQAKKME